MSDQEDRELRELVEAAHVAVLRYRLGDQVVRDRLSVLLAPLLQAKRERDELVEQRRRESAMFKLVVNQKAVTERERDELAAQIKAVQAERDEMAIRFGSYELLAEAINDNDIPCPDSCDSYAHATDCPHVSVVATLEKQQERLAAAEEAQRKAEEDVQRLRQQNHEAASKRDKRYADDMKDLARLRGLMKEAREMHEQDMARQGKPIWSEISSYGQGAAALLVERARNAEELEQALRALRIDANRLCDRNLGGSYEADCRASIAIADAALGWGQALSRPEAPACAVCGKPATCLGRYEGPGPEEHACDECCGHGNEDGRCRPISRPEPRTPATDEALFQRWGPLLKRLSDTPEDKP